MLALINIDHLIFLTPYRIGQQPIVNIQAVPNYSKCKWTNGTLFITTMGTLYTHFYMTLPMALYSILSFVLVLFVI